MARLLTRPTPARQDVPFPKQGRRRVETGGVASGYVEDAFEARTTLADVFSILIRQLSHCPTLRAPFVPAQGARMASAEIPSGGSRRPGQTPDGPDILTCRAL